MSAFLNQVFSLLTTPAGSLSYHLVLAFSILGAFLASILLSRRGEFLPARRAAAGLLLLLLLRLALFAAAGLGSQGIINAGVVLPLIDRAVTLLGLIVIIWLWAFPEPRRTADTGFLLMVMITLAVFALGIAWWVQQDFDGTLNGSPVDSAAEIFALVLLASGSLLVILRRPVGWALGLSTFILLALGHLGHLLLPAIVGDYPSAVRLAQIPAYALLLYLPYRFALPRPLHTAVPVAAEDEKEGYWVSPQAFPALLAAAGETDAAGLCQSLARTIAHFMQADLCILVRGLEQADSYPVACAYNRVADRFLKLDALDAQQIPELSAAIDAGSSRRLSAASLGADVLGVARMLAVDPACLLLVPFAAGRQAGSPVDIRAVLLLSPYSQRQWTGEDETHAAGLAAALGRMLLPGAGRTAVDAELAGTQQQLEAARQQVRLSQEENERLIEQLGNLSQAADSDRTQLESLAAVVSVQDEIQKNIENLRAENEALKRAVAEAEAAQPQISEEKVQGELLLALQEVALLKTALAEADQKIATIQNGSSGSRFSGEQLEVIASIAQELRQPMSSMTGYTDYLLGESVGTLGSTQKKFLERIKELTRQMGQLVDDLTHVTNLGSGHFQLTFKEFELSAVIDEAAADTSGQFKDRNLTLRVDLAPSLPRLSTDQEAFTQVLVHLLQNAGDATPPGGEVWLRARSEDGDGEQDTLLLQVTDQGGGILPADLPRIFSRVYRSESSPIPGLGDRGVGMAIVKTLVEALGGRIWADSEVGKGATFSILLPSPADDSRRKPLE